MKERRAFGAMLCVVLLLLVSLTGCSRLPSFDGSVAVSGTVIDNDLNNVIAGGNLLRIEDTLYYNYGQNDSRLRTRVGLSADGVTVEDGSMYGAFDPGFGLPVMRKYHNSIVCSPSDVSLSEDVPLADIFFQQTETVCVYLRYNEETLEAAVDRTASLVAYENGKETVLAEDVILWQFYVSNDTVYYLKKSDVGYKLREYDLRTRTDEAVAEQVIHYVPDEFFVIDSMVVLSLPDGVYITTPSEKHALTCIKIGPTSLNIYNGSVYIAAEDGVFCYDPTAGKVHALCSRSAEECYILDDTWVYFVSDNASLWRVSQDGQTEEHVYG